MTTGYLVTDGLIACQKKLSQVYFLAQMHISQRGVPSNSGESIVRIN